MQSAQIDAYIFQKAGLKHKLSVKVHVTQKSQIMIAKFWLEDSLVALGRGDGMVKIYNIFKNIKIADINTNIKDKESSEITPINAIRWRPSNQKMESMGAVFLAANTNGHLFQYIAKTSKQIFHTIEQDNQIMAIDYCSDGRLFCTAGKDNMVRVYDEQTKKIVHRLKGVLRYKAGHNNRLFAVKYKPENNALLASGGWDQCVNIWDLRIGQVVSSLIGPKITGEAIDFRDDMILTGASRPNDQLQLWDFRTKAIIHTFLWDQQKKQTSIFLNSAQFCRNSRNTVIAAGGNQMKMFALDDYTQQFQLRVNENEALYTCDASATNNKYIAGGKLGAFYYINTNKYVE